MIVEIIVLPLNGIASLINDGLIEYIPNKDFNGNDILAYRIFDGEFYDTAQVSITIVPVNDAPLAVDDNSSTNEDESAAIDVQTNDSDVDGDRLTTEIVSRLH